jgi:cysteinyl-tRNA synthetase
MVLQLTNTFTGKKERIHADNNVLKMYVCGITPYDYAHVGHGRCYVTFDLLYRFLRHQGYSVTYARNFTDIDDKLLCRSEKEFGTPFRYHEIAQRFINAYHEDMKQLQCLAPTHEPLVTEHIPHIISFIEKLIEKGYAYVVDGDVYYRIASFPSYGALSKQNINELCAGARVEQSDIKENPLDFALWKGEKEGAFWKSPWGYGRPGWHIECSVLSDVFLGSTIDIHGGGMDLMFPHHENERAQSDAYHHHSVVKLWAHNAFVRINQEKMSKSLGNFFTLRDVFKEFDPMVVRYMILTHHYRSPLDFSFDELQELTKVYQRLCRLFENTPALPIEQSIVAQKMIDMIADDLNTPGMLGVLYENSSLLRENAQERGGVKTVLQQIAGLSLQPLPEKQVEITPEIKALLEERTKAREQKDWARADALRDELKKLGYTIQDKKS